MLKGVTLHLLEKFDTVSVVARSSAGFEILEKNAGKNSPKIHRVQKDYTNFESIKNLISGSINKFGQISMVISWIHSIAPGLPFIIAEIINISPSQCDYFDILGSAYANPAVTNDKREKEFSKLEHINYHKVILGFVRDGNSSRWLRNDEISFGIITAITGNYHEYLVGTVESWNKRP